MAKLNEQTVRAIVGRILGMSLKDELEEYVQKTVDEQWERRAG